MTTIPMTPYELGVYLCGCLQNLKYHAGNSISGIVPNGLDFTEVEDALSETYLFESADKVTREVTFKYPLLFANDFKSLLVKDDFCKSKPDHFYLINDNYTYPNQPMPADVSGYENAMMLIESLRHLADYAIPQVHPHTLVFIGKGKLEISVKFTGSQLFGLDKVKSFDSDFVNTDIHKEQKKKIVVTVLLEMFSGQSTIDAGAVFEKFSEFHRKTCSSYELYVADFSFEKIKGEVVKEKVDSIIKVNKIFSDIQNQLLAVPIAILLAGGQLDQTGKDPIKNVLIWLGILVFSVFMSFLIRNQRNSLASVNAEVLQHREQLRSKYQAIASKFSEDFKDVSKRISHQVNLLRVVDLVVASIFIGITVLTLSFNGWLDEFLHNLLLIVDKTTYLILLGIAAIAVWIKGFVS